MSKYAERQQRKFELQREATYAMKTGNLDLVKKHFAKGRYDYGMDRNDTWANRTREFAAAAIHGHTNIIDFFLENGGNVNNHGGHLLSVAAFNGQNQMLDYLVKKGASKYSINHALSNAVEHGHSETVKLLVEHGADLHFNNDWALQIACACTENNLIKTLLIDLQMTVKPETQQWLEENNHTYATQLIAKRELNKKLTQSSEHRPPQTQNKEKKMKI